MPGTRLNDVERRLRDWWLNSKDFPYPVLSGLSTMGETGLRGIRHLALDLDYPLTVLCGKNGVGKTTLLALAALAFHSPPGHSPVNARRRPRGNDRSYYTFSDFFFKGPGDPDITGVEIRWKYRGAGSKEVVLKKRSDKWMHYERRPPRPVHFLGVTRAVPAIEQAPLRTHFGIRTPDRPRGQQLDAEFRGRLGDIMGHTYEDASVMVSWQYSLRACVADAPYSGFNMGCGEDVLIGLMYYLQTVPKGSMVVVEEIELGLHPEALTRLARHLQEIMLGKQLQVIMSTHSEHFLNAVPKEARILLRREGKHHLVVHGPSTAFAVSSMAASSIPELSVYCEDAISEQLIKACLSSDVRQRVQVRPIGSWSELPKVADSLIRAGLPTEVILCADGGPYVGEFFRQCEVAASALGDAGRRLHWSALPGQQPPERWMADVLQDDEGRLLLANELRVSEERVRDYLVCLTATSDPHDGFYRLAQMLGMSEDEMERALVRCVAHHPQDPLRSIRSDIEAVLEGHRITRGCPRGSSGSDLVPCTSVPDSCPDTGER